MHFGRENRISQRKVPEDIIEPLPTSNNFFLNSDNYLEHKITANTKTNLGPGKDGYWCPQRRTVDPTLWRVGGLGFISGWDQVIRCP